MPTTSRVTVLARGSVLLFGLSLVYAVTLLVTNDPRQLADADRTWAERVTFHPTVLAGAAALAALAAWVERRLENALAGSADVEPSVRAKALQAAASLAVYIDDTM